MALITGIPNSKYNHYKPDANHRIRKMPTHYINNGTKAFNLTLIITAEQTKFFKSFGFFQDIICTIKKQHKVSFLVKKVLKQWSGVNFSTIRRDVTRGY